MKGLAATGVAGGLVLGGAGVASAAGAFTPGHHHRYGLSGVVQSTSANSFVLGLRHDRTATVDTTGSTTYSEPGTTLTPTGVTTNEDVLVVPVPGSRTTGPAPSAFTVTAKRVVILVERVTGTVQGLTGTGFTLQTWGTHTVDVITSGSTTYTQDGSTVSGVSPNERVLVVGTPDPTVTGALDAISVHILGNWPTASNYTSATTNNAPTWTPPGATTSSTTTSPTEVSGAVQSVSTTDDTITLIDARSGDPGWQNGSDPPGQQNGSTTTIDVTDTTTYSDPSGQATLNDVQPGDHITAKGTETNGTFTATSVFIAPAGSTNPCAGPGGKGSPGSAPDAEVSGGPGSPTTTGDFGGHPGQPGPGPGAGGGGGGPGPSGPGGGPRH